MNFTLVKPIITEASMKDAARGVFTFEVRHEANKTEIKSAVEKAFNVNVKGVRTVTIKRLKVVNTKFGRKSSKSIQKKARIELMKGQSIPAFEIKEEKEDKKTKKAKEVKE